MLPDWVRPGASYTMKTTRIVHHVRAIVDDQAVVRYWRRSKQRWQYECLDEYWYLAFDDQIKRRK